tara:strand:+ start:362 stop:688 length:327 start_codon:yes stop_codon:yes gene_type:complete
MKTINLTREGLSAISLLIERSDYLSQILDGSSHFTENCDWSFDKTLNRNTYKLHLPEDKIDILKFLFKSEISKNATKSFWGTGNGAHLSTRASASKMLKKIVKVLEAK